jgi:hypothetical protein
MKNPSRLKDLSIPTFKSFMQRKRSLKLYKDLLVEINKINFDDDLRKSLKEQVKFEFINNRNLNDPNSIKYCMKFGTDSLKRIINMRNSQSSIINNNDIDNDEEDQRGRVGKGWPWEAK